MSEQKCGHCGRPRSEHDQRVGPMWLHCPVAFRHSSGKPIAWHPTNRFTAARETIDDVCKAAPGSFQKFVEKLPTQPPLIPNTTSELPELGWRYRFEQEPEYRACCRIDGPDGTVLYAVSKIDAEQVVRMLNQFGQCGVEGHAETGQLAVCQREERPKR